MNRIRVTFAATLLSTAVLGGLGGCSDSEPITPSQSTKEGTGLNKTPAGMEKPMPEPTPVAADLTHVLTKDSPYYKATPAQAKPADGTLKSGTKLLLLTPSGSYSQVWAENGVKAYVATDNLKPIK